VRAFVLCSTRALPLTSDLFAIVGFLVKFLEVRPVFVKGEARHFKFGILVDHDQC